MVFHNKKAKRYNQLSIYNQGALSGTYVKFLDIIGDVKGGVVLDFGCGNGWASQVFAAKGARVVGIDISLSILMKAQERIEIDIQNKICFVLGSGEQLPFKKAFDLVAGIAILHHLDTSLTIDSIKSVLKENGRAVFMEPLNHNPIINLYRKLTPHKRTKDEQPLDIQYIANLKKMFSKVEIHGYDLFALLAYVFVPVKQFGLFRFFHTLLTRFDEKVLLKFPWLQKYCWGVIIEISK